MPDFDLQASVGWQLPGGRKAAEHHLFPHRVEPGAGLQAPRLPGELYKASGLDLGLVLRLNGATVEQGPWQHAAAAAPTDLSAARIFLGDHQVQFIKAWIALLREPDWAVKAMVRRGTFFLPKPRGLPPKKNLPKLLQEVCLCVCVAWWGKGGGDLGLRSARGVIRRDVAGEPGACGEV